MRVCGFGELCCRLLAPTFAATQHQAKEAQMTHLLDRIADIAAKRARYQRTVAELKAIPLDTALDLDLYPGDAEKIAHRAVYGH